MHNFLLFLFPSRLKHENFDDLQLKTLQAEAKMRKSQANDIIFHLFVGLYFLLVGFAVSVFVYFFCGEWLKEHGYSFTLRDFIILTNSLAAGYFWFFVLRNLYLKISYNLLSTELKSRKAFVRAVFFPHFGEDKLKQQELKGRDKVFWMDVSSII